MREDIKEVMAGVFRISASEIGDDAKINQLTNWDSLGHITLMLALEERFKLRIDSESILQLLSLEAIEQYISRNAPPAC